MTLPASVRVNTSVPFPALVIANGPVTVTKNTGIWTLGFNISNLAAVPNGTSAANIELLVWNTAAGSFQQITASALPTSFIFNGTTFPGSAGSQTVILGTLASNPVLTNTGQAILFNTTGNGAVLQGDGSVADVVLMNKNGGVAMFVPTGTFNTATAGASIVQGTTAVASAAGNTVVNGTLAAAPTLTNTGQAVLYNTVVNGAVLQGDGSTNDIMLANKNGATVMVVPTGTQSAAFSNAIVAVGGIFSQSSSAGIGYLTGVGAGSSVTQITSRTTGVTLNFITGAITMFAAAPVVGTPVSFTLTNSAIAATDVIVVSVKSSNAANTYRADVSATAAGSCQITMTSLAGTTSDSPVINFAVIKGSAN